MSDINFLAHVLANYVPSNLYGTTNANFSASHTVAIWKFTFDSDPKGYNIFSSLVNKTRNMKTLTKLFV